MGWLVLNQDLSGFEGWMDKKNDFHWIRIQPFSKPLSVGYKKGYQRLKEKGISEIIVQF